ncbi:tetratricopeptide repeat protein [Methylobacterium sp. P31]
MSWYAHLTPHRRSALIGRGRGTNRSATERHLAAILIADIVGYSRLMGADEEGTLQRFRSLRSRLINPAIRRHEGRVVKSTGDGVLAEFASAVEAVRCALDLQQAMIVSNAELPEEKRICCRIGVNAGEVMIERDGDIYGDSVNLAARLEALAPCGGLCFSRTARDQIRDRIALAYEDWGERSLKNIARPVRVFAVTPETIAARPAEGPVQLQGPGRQFRAVVAAVAACLVAGGTWYVLRPVAPPAAPPTLAATPASGTGLLDKASQGMNAPRLSIVVLPFANLSDDPEQDYLAESITADLTTDLSRIRESFVIASGTALSYKGKTLDLRQVGRDLGVRYALLGSVRRAGDKIRINAQLADAATGAQIWSDRFEGDRSTFADLRDDLTARLARTLDLELTDAESRRAQKERSGSLDASDLAMRGWSVLNRPISPKQLIEAQVLFQQSLKLDPHHMHARVGLARTLAAKAKSRMSDVQEADLARAEALNDEVLTAYPDDAMAQFVRADILRGRKQFDGAVAGYRMAIALNRNLAPFYGAMASALLRAGRSAEAIPQIDHAVRLSPRDPLLSFWLYIKCHAYTHLTQDEKAIEWCQRSLAASAVPYWASYVDLAASNAWLGRRDEARSAVESLLKLKPGYTVGHWQREGWSDNPTFLR